LLEQDHDKKLLPLRKFAKSGGYSTAYLSQLVQRKKLKAKKIGRNYFTTEEWFNGYLDRHAQDKKQIRYNGGTEERTDNQKPVDEFIKLAVNNKKANFFVLPESFQNQLKIKQPKSIFKRIAVTTAILVFLFVNIYFLYLAQNRGQVAGVEEMNMATSTSYVNYDQGK